MKKKQFKLPNNMQVSYLNRAEVTYTYDEIFVEQVYLKNGITLERGACVFDIGANIGMFTMFVKDVCSDSKIYSFEPVPELYCLLQENTAAYGSDVNTFQIGISDRESKEIFTYYPNYSIFSGLHTNKEDDKRILSLGIKNQLPERFQNNNQMIESTVENKLQDSIEFECQLNTISNIMREFDINKIDLLKIDAEKSELQILNGIDFDDWCKIDQIVLEAHTQEQSDSIVSLLKLKNFSVVVEQEPQFVETGITNIFAIRGLDSNV